MARAEPISQESGDVLKERLTELRQLIPEAFTEGKVDFDKLRSVLGDTLSPGPERYNFNWAGKRDAIQILQTTSRGTLVPDKNESVEFDKTKNIFIEGENLEVLKLLYKSYFGQVKMIYIDPPYNTGKEFIYPDSFSDPLDAYLKLTGQKDTDGNILTSNPETSGRFHSAWLSMMYPRLFIARQLLREDGIIFISIDDHEVYNLRLLMNEIFGEENFITTIIWQKVFSPKNTARHFSEDHDYILVYARNAENWRPFLLPRTEEADARYDNPDKDKRGPWSSSDLTARNYYSKGQYEVTSPSGKKFNSGIGTYWRSPYEKFLELDKDGRIYWGPNGDNMPRLKRFLSEVKQGIVPQTLWSYKIVGHTQEAKKELLEYVHFDNSDNVLDTVKPTRLIRQMLRIATSTTDNDLILDFFAGSAPTGHSVLNQNYEDGGNRRFICIQLPEPLPVPEKRLKTIADIGKERLRTVINEKKKNGSKKLGTDTHSQERDLGVRIFKLNPSNIRPWESPTKPDGQKLLEQMKLHIDPLIPGWTVENLIYEILIKEGLSLTVSIEKIDGIKTNTIYRINDEEKSQELLICLDGTLKSETGKTLLLKKEDIFICRDVALTDELAANLALQCRLKTI